jgi:hypothetical protein
MQHSRQLKKGGFYTTPLLDHCLPPAAYNDLMLLMIYSSLFLNATALL